MVSISEMTISRNSVRATLIVLIDNDAVVIKTRGTPEFSTVVVLYVVCDDVIRRFTEICLGICCRIQSGS